MLKSCCTSTRMSSASSRQRLIGLVRRQRHTRRAAAGLSSSYRHHNDNDRRLLCSSSSVLATSRSTSHKICGLQQQQQQQQLQQQPTAVLNINSNNNLLRVVPAAGGGGSGGLRLFSSTSSGGGGGDDGEKSKKKKQPDPFSLADDDDDDTTDDDPFGLDFIDGDDQGKIGPSDNLPPKYKRDTATGRWGSEVEVELSSKEKQILKSDPIEKDQMLLNRLERHWATKAKATDDNIDDEINELGERIRSADMGLNVLGRSVQAQQQAAAAAKSAEGDDDEDIDNKFSQNLTQDEFQAFKGYMKKKYNIDNLSEDEIPVIEDDDNEKKRFGGDNIGDNVINADDSDLALKWMTTRGQREMDDLLDDDPFSDLMPGDLSPTRLINRKKAKPLPSQLLHHNNLELLRQFLTPTGQVMNRVQTRLGARDQRKIAKLVKRARALGLLPYQGQFKIERHGWKHANDIHEERDWEKELIDRGLVIDEQRSRNRKQQQQQPSSSSSTSTGFNNDTNKSQQE